MQARIRIPSAHLSDFGRTSSKAKPTEISWCGGDMRIGDLDGDGTVDFVLAKSVGGMKTTYIGAFRWNGTEMWRWGKKYRRALNLDNDQLKEYVTEPPQRPGPLLVVDIDGDGRADVVAMVLKEDVAETNMLDTQDMEFIILDGATGQVKRRASPEALRQANAIIEKTGKPEPSNYVHQRLMAADFRGLGRPGDFIIKLGDHVIACDDQLNVLWTYRNKFAKYGEHASYIPAVGDVDDDGKDEVAGGQYLLDDDGKVLFEKMMANHNDSVAVVDWDGDETNGREVVMSGFGQVVNAKCDSLARLGSEVVPHGQEVRCGPFLPDVPGIQMAVRYDGHNPRILIADRAGQVVKRFSVDPSPINCGLETVYWNGRKESAP